jgi:two-component system sensor histidine kinase VicK
LNDVATHGEVNIRILVPYDRRIREFISSLNANNNSIEKKSRTKKINVRYLEPVLNTKMSILIVDRKSSLAVELKDDTKDNIQQAIGLSSIPTANQLCYRTFRYLKPSGNKQKCTNN